MKLSMMTHPFDDRVRRELRASHAGETGAVWIYHGVLAANRLQQDQSIERFARAHLKTERQHLHEFKLVSHQFRSSLCSGLWVLAGFSLGFVASILGRDWLYYSIYRVEAFVDQHYQAQIQQLSHIACPEAEAAIALFQQCNLDEVEHRDQAKAALKHPPNRLMKIWGAAIEQAPAWPFCWPSMFSYL